MIPKKDNGEEKEYVFHFKLEEQPPSGKDLDSLTALVKSQLQSLLDVIVLTNAGRDVEVDGFRFIETGSPNHTIFDGPSGERRESEDEER